MPAAVEITAFADKPVRDRGARLLAANGYLVKWLGFVYSDHGDRAEDAWKDMLRRVASGTSIDQAVASLRGAFFCCVTQEATGHSHAFVDNSGLFTAYRCGQGVSSSFMKLCSAADIRAKDLSREHLLEFLQLGNVYLGDTLCDRIQKLGSREVVVIQPEGVSVLEKQIPKLSDLPMHAQMRQAMQPLADCLRHERVSVDLTGGFDSRMLACLLHEHGIPFEAAIAGRPTDTDARVGGQVAAALGCSYHFSQYDSTSLPEDLETVLQRLEGMGGTILTTHRLLQLNADRMERGITVALKGSGGELYKDFFWTQDFPFYRSTHTRMARLHRLRIEFELLTEGLLTHDAYQTFLSARERRLRRLSEAYRAPFNTQSYDNVYFYERVQTWNSRTITSCQESRLQIHAPLCELALAQIGFHADRSNRFYNRFHREQITRSCPAASRVRTTDGTSASSRPYDLLKDGLGYSRVKGKKLLKKISQLAFNKTRFVPTDYTITDDVMQSVTSSQIARQALDTLKQANLLRPEVTYAQISPRFTENAVVLGWLMDQLDRPDAASDANNDPQNQ